MEEFLRSYGIWILLAAVFFGMQWFGMGCCGGHRHGEGGNGEPQKPEERRSREVHSGQSRGCH